MKSYTKNVFVWAPRILTIAFIIFLSIFALDAFEGDAPFIEKALGFLIHLLPSAILAIILVIAWKHCLYGGIILILTSILFTFFFETYNNIYAFLSISMVLALCGILFIVSRYVSRRPRVTASNGKPPAS